MLRFDHVSFAVGGNEILKDVCFDIAPGELVAIIGESGAGKSSLFRLLTGERKPTEGAIYLDDFSLQDVSYDGLQGYRRQIGIIFQDFRLLREKTVYENIAFALEVCGEEEHIKKRVPEALRLVHLEHRQHAFPRELSGGECQRTAIARALVHHPKILIADEATGNLDPKNSLEIADIFLQLNRERGLTILFATHNPLLIDRMHPRVLQLQGGRLVADVANISH